jgi:hypothetical protein
MDAFSYISAVPSIIIALGLTRLLVGAGKILESRNKVKNYWVHNLWVFNLFLYMVLNWWVLFRWENQELWSFPLLMFLLLIPTVTFLQSVILFTDHFHEGSDLKKTFYSDSRWFFALAALLPPLDLLDTSLKGIPHLIAQGPIYIVTISLITALSIVGVLTKNERYHKFFAVFFLIYMSIFISINLNILV